MKSTNPTSGQITETGLSDSPAMTSGVTKALLSGSVIAGPIYVVVGLIEMLTRPGYDLRRHSLSLMSNGDLGWIHITMLILTGLLTIAGAVGMRRILAGSRGGTWGPILVAVYGLGLIGAGIFVADPALGFPPGTPADANTVSWHGLGHFISGALGFFGLIIACFVFARRFATLNQRGWALYSVATGVLFFAAFFGIASGAGNSWINVAFSIAVVIAWAWVSAISVRLMR